MQRKPFFHLIKSKHAPFVLDVIPDAGRKGPWLADSHHHLVVDDLDQMVQRVVLKKHWQAMLVSEKCFSYGEVLEAEFTDHHCQRILSRYANFQIRCAITGIDGLGVLQQIVAEPFGHSFAADQTVDGVHARQLNPRRSPSSKRYFKKGG